MNKRMKRNLLILTVVLFVSAAAYLNWNYSQSAANVGKILGESTLVNGSGEGSTLKRKSLLEANRKFFSANSDYFDTARLNRKESRDNALALLERSSR